MSRTMLEIQQGQLQEPINDRDNTLGNENATVGIVEYGDYECPYCAAAHPVVSDMLRLRSSAVLFAFRHFPWLVTARRVRGRVRRGGRCSGTVLDDARLAVHPSAATRARCGVGRGAGHGDGRFGLVAGGVGADLGIRRCSTTS